MKICENHTFWLISSSQIWSNFWKIKLDKKCTTSTQNTVVLKSFLQEVYMDILSSKIIRTFSLVLWILIFFRFLKICSKLQKFLPHPIFSYMNVPHVCSSEHPYLKNHTLKSDELLPKKNCFSFTSKLSDLWYGVGRGGRKTLVNFAPPPGDLNSGFRRHCREMYR